MTIPDQAELKRQLRARMRATPVASARHNARILDLVTQWLEHNPRYQHIALYHPLPDEPDLLPLMDRLPSRTWHFPRISGDQITFHRVSSTTDDLTPGVFGILEPKQSIPSTPADEIQAFLCPGLAFEKTTGYRLGRGKGYYDRYLADTSATALLAGVTFPEHLVENTLAEPHDIRMHLVFY